MFNLYTFSKRLEQAETTQEQVAGQYYRKLQHIRILFP